MFASQPLAPCGDLFLTYSFPRVPEEMRKSPQENRLRFWIKGQRETAERASRNGQNQREKKEPPIPAESGWKRHEKPVNEVELPVTAAHLVQFRVGASDQ